MPAIQSIRLTSALLVLTVGEAVGAGAVVDTESNMTKCQFDLEPIGPGYFWDPACANGGLGCLADGKNHECRFCGHGVYREIACPYSSCTFVNEPIVPYYWDVNCTLGQLGCWADGVHAECRFCGDAPYTTIQCPEAVGGAKPENKKEDEGDEYSIAAADDGECHFPNEPSIAYFWDESCKMGDLGCNADGIHIQCRFCASRPFETISCPDGVGPDTNRCDFPQGSEPTSEIYFWDSDCEMGMLGCWADGVNSECRFCGGTGSYRTVSCPTTIVTGAIEAKDEDEAALEASKSLSESRNGQSPGVEKDIQAVESGEVVSLSGAPASSGSHLAFLAPLAFVAYLCAP
mmetsp:Transcript_41957/g.90633  ORF Transcript_41957/g.90633 Transcript_41957/m.90633 type:complete len:346 (-) Transcript_41957:59-1096(-)